MSVPIFYAPQGGSALQAFDGNNIGYRAQLWASGEFAIYKTTDGGNTWNINNYLSSSLYTLRDVDIQGDGGSATGTVYRSASCPVVSGYTPVAVAGYRCAGDAGIGRQLFDLYVTSGVCYANYVGSIPSYAHLYVQILYLRTN